MKRGARALCTALLAGSVLLGTAACGPAGLAPTGSSGTVTGSATGAGQTALAVLATLPVKGRAPQTGYDRDQFGPAWADVDRNGCDTRNDVLTRDLTGEVYKPGTQDCVVLRGSLADPYTGATIAFERGNGTSVDIDHVVALGDAWQTGAFAWDTAKRTALANDPLNLLAVDYSANRQKGDGDAASWLPGNKGYRCAYVARQVAVKAAYGLWVTPAEHDAIDTVLAGCPDEPVPATGTPAPEPAPAPAPATGTPFANCAAARAAGAAPLHRGDPGYSTAMDGDGDGTACE
ncbi:MAG: Excalibur calcium-binding protein [Modestobacter sp.]|nr:Excalibur calcium-binding protein [Modestobacter sp.]MCW2677378.1 hypothetical protein [Modestobacter sp.]